MTIPKAQSVSSGNVGPRKPGSSKNPKHPEPKRGAKTSTARSAENSSPTPRASRQSFNVLKSRHKKTDDVIECLHKSLMDQLSSTPAAAKSGVLDSSISGALAPRLGRRGEAANDHARQATSERKKRECAQIALIVSKTQELVLLGQGLGIDMTATAKNVAHARAALGRGETGVARDWAGSADWRARDQLSVRYPSVARRITASLRQLESECGIESNLRRMLAEAKQSMKAEDYGKGLRLLIDARDAIKKAQTGVVLRVIAEAKGDFVKAKKAGLSIDKSVDILSMARDKLKRGEFTEAVKFARDSRSAIEDTINRQREARHPLVECAKEIKLAELMGADVNGLNELFSEAKRLYKQNDTERSAERSRKLLDLARRTSYGKAAESYQLAEKSLALARKTAPIAAEAEDKLIKAKECLDRNELAKSQALSCACIFESDAAIANALADRLRSFDDFAKGIERDVDSLTEVQEGIDSSKLRNLENLKKYASQTEAIIAEAYECAASYARVAQDIVKQAYENSIEAGQIVDRDPSNLGLASTMESTEKQSISEKRKKIADLFLNGKVSESQLDRLLLMIDSSVEKDNLV